MRSLSTLIFLIAAYIAAVFIPQPGQWLRTEVAAAPKLMLAVLLFCAGICTSRQALKSVARSRHTILLGMGLSWLLPALAAVLVALCLLAVGAPLHVCAGVFIVAAMPVANSSVGWSSYLGGNVAASVALLLSATALSPIITSAIIRLGAGAVLQESAEELSLAWQAGLSVFFVLWVFVPVVAGVVCASLLSESQSLKVNPIARRIGFTVLVLLNYLNGASFLPILTEKPWMLLWPVLSAGALLVATMFAARWIQELASSTQPSRIREAKSVELAIVLRNTGAALVFAGAALPELPTVSMTIIAYTLLQHLAVAGTMPAVDANGTGTDEAQATDAAQDTQPNEQLALEN